MPYGHRVLGKSSELFHTDLSKRQSKIKTLGIRTTGAVNHQVHHGKVCVIVKL